MCLTPDILMGLRRRRLELSHKTSWRQIITRAALPGHDSDREKEKDRGVERKIDALEGLGTLVFYVVVAVVVSQGRKTS